MGIISQYAFMEIECVRRIFFAEAGNVCSILAIMEHSPVLKNGFTEWCVRDCRLYCTSVTKT